MMRSRKWWAGVAALNGFVAVVMGAVAAHALADPQAAAMAEKASLYQLIHAAVLVMLAAHWDKATAPARWFFLCGIILFCGSIYVRGLLSWPQATAAAPIGGVALTLGWLSLALLGFRKDGG